MTQMLAAACEEAVEIFQMRQQIAGDDHIERGVEVKHLGVGNVNIITILAELVDALLVEIDADYRL
jgi:hypothetical protein